MYRNQTACSALGVRRRGFTLIEMLVVLLIIAILSGMVFALMGLVGPAGDKADTVRRVEMLANAIEEFRAEYGKYPPVPQYGGQQPVRYEWPILNNGIILPSDDGRQYGLSDGDANSIVNGTFDKWKGLPEDERSDAYAKGDGARLFTFGLASFLIRRYEPREADEGTELWDPVYGTDPPAPYQEKGFGMAAPLVVFKGPDPIDPMGRAYSVQWYDHNDGYEDKAADKRATDRMKYYVLKAGPHRDWTDRDYGSLRYRNRYLTFRDAWRRELRYESHPPYDSYRLWSLGPDGKDGTDDDIVVAREAK